MLLIKVSGLSGITNSRKYLFQLRHTFCTHLPLLCLMFQQEERTNQKLTKIVLNVNGETNYMPFFVTGLKEVMQM